MTDPVGRLPDGAEYLRWTPPLPLDAAWRLHDDSEGLRARWLALRSALSEAGQLDGAIRRLMETWTAQGRFVRPILSGGRSHLASLLEVGIDAAVAASAEDGVDLTKWPDDQGRRQAADLMARVIRQNIDVTPAEVAQLHGLLCPNLKPSRYTGSSAVKSIDKISKGKFRQHMAIIIGADQVLREAAPVEQVVPSLVGVIRTNLAARMAGVPSLVRAAWVLYAFGVVHPFYDGNGRVARTLASMALVRAGGFPLMFPPTAHLRYLRCILAARQGNPGALIAFFVEYQARVLEDALEVLSRGEP